MPRVSAEEKARSHGRIVREAAALIREQGFEKASVSDIMQAAGMTHGGFYRHFSSKDELVAAAFDLAVEEAMAGLAEAETEAEQASALDAYVDRYLSQAHVDTLAAGCPLASLAADATRAGDAVRSVAGDGAKTALSLIAAALGDRPDRARALLALLIGSVTLARIAPSEAEKTAQLEAARAAAARIIGR